MNQIKIPFKGWDLIAWINTHEGSARIAVRPICEAIGVDWKTQHRKLTADNRFTCGHMTTHDSSGRVQEMLALPVEEINCWLFGISPKKVKAEVEPKLREFQLRNVQLIH